MIVTTQLETFVEPDDLADVVAGCCEGGRFIGIFATSDEGGVMLRAVLESEGEVQFISARLESGRSDYRALSAKVSAASWYERALHDLFGLVPVGHPRLDPLVFPLAEGPDRPRPGMSDGAVKLSPDVSSLPPHVRGEGVFSIPYGPVRSGVFESVEYVVETFGEDIPRLHVLPYVKHRGVARRFSKMTPVEGALLAERTEGTMSVSHAIALCSAVEEISETVIPEPAEQLRLVHAELERIANHLESMIRHAEGSGQAVAFTRLSLHKEQLMRLRGKLCGHRFARGVVVPGGTSGPPLIPAGEALKHFEQLSSELSKDISLLMATPSFLDRLKGSGVLTSAEARSHGAVGPVGRGSGVGVDVRLAHPYGPYRAHVPRSVRAEGDGDAFSRQQIRAEEIATSSQILRQALADLAGPIVGGPWKASVPTASGASLARVESPHGELVYLLEMRDGVLTEVNIRTASFHNLALFSQAFRGDILTDFVFIEASFGLNMAGVAG